MTDGRDLIQPARGWSDRLGPERDDGLDRDPSPRGNHDGGQIRHEQCAGHSGEDERPPFRAHEKNRRIAERGGVRIVDRRCDWFAQPLVRRVAHDADHLDTSHRDLAD